MAITISGNGITSANIADGTITNADINASAAIDASKLTGVGKVLQVVSTSKTDTYSVSLGSGGESGDVTGLTASITPTSTSSKVLVTLTVSIHTSTMNQPPTFSLFRGGSRSGFVGDASGSRKRVSGGTAGLVGSRDNTTATIMFLDSPSTTSSTTYSVRLSHNEGATMTVYLNRSYIDDDANYASRSASSITLMEIGA